VNFHRYTVGSQIVVLGNDDEKAVIELRTNHLKLLGGTTLSLHNATLHLGCDVSLGSSVPKIKFL